jgi:hypothetical protein
MPVSKKLINPKIPKPQKSKIVYFTNLDLGELKGFTRWKPITSLTITIAAKYIKIVISGAAITKAKSFTVIIPIQNEIEHHNNENLVNHFSEKLMYGINLSSKFTPCSVFV